MSNKSNNNGKKTINYDIYNFIFNYKIQIKNFSFFIFKLSLKLFYILYKYKSNNIVRLIKYKLLYINKYYKYIYI